MADALDSGSSGGNFVEVQVLLPAPKKREYRGYSLFFLSEEDLKGAAQRTALCAVRPRRRSSCRRASLLLSCITALKKCNVRDIVCKNKVPCSAPLFFRDLAPLRFTPVLCLGYLNAKRKRGLRQLQQYRKRRSDAHKFRTTICPSGTNKSIFFIPPAAMSDLYRNENRGDRSACHAFIRPPDAKGRKACLLHTFSGRNRTKNRIHHYRRSVTFAYCA